MLAIQEDWDFNNFYNVNLSNLVFYSSNLFGEYLKLFSCRESPNVFNICSWSPLILFLLSHRKYHFKILVALIQQWFFYAESLQVNFQSSFSLPSRAGGMVEGTNNSQNNNSGYKVLTECQELTPPMFSVTP